MTNSFAKIVPEAAMVEVVQPITAIITIATAGDALGAAGTTAVTRIQTDLYRPQIRLTNVGTYQRSPITFASKALEALEWDGDFPISVPSRTNNCDPYQFITLGAPMVKSGTDVTVKLDLFNGAIAGVAQICLVGFRRIQQIGSSYVTCEREKMQEVDGLPVVTGNHNSKLYR